jgi:hypothetical protein
MRGREARGAEWCSAQGGAPDFRRLIFALSLGVACSHSSRRGYTFDAAIRWAERRALCGRCPAGLRGIRLSRNRER